MSMRIWLPGVLGLILVGLIGLMAAYTTSRGRSISRQPAALAAVEEDPRLVTARSSRSSSPSPSPSPSWAISAVQPAPTPVPDLQQAPAGEGEARAVEASPQAGERDQQVAKLRASGPDPGSLTAKVKPLQETWETMAKRSGIEVDVSPWECYGGGCFTTIVHQAPQSVEELTSKILASQELASWPGPQTRSAPIPRTDGTAEVTWFLLTPQQDGQ
jgi:hypothetical protein